MPNESAYPIIYVRGFAGGTSGIDSAADDPFYGFNDGATHVRVGGDGQPQFYQFEGPLVRLMEDEDYRVPMHGGQQAYLSRSAAGSQPRTSVWIYRFYDPDTDTFGAAAVPYDLPTAGRPDLPQHDPEGVRTTASRPAAWSTSSSRTRPRTTASTSGSSGCTSRCRRSRRSTRRSSTPRSCTST